MSGPQYAAAGVDLEGAERAKRRILEAVAGTRTPFSVGRPGAFGSMVRVPPGMRNPVLVMSTDGVGTKVLVAAAMGQYDTVGEDLVNHSVNDILVHRARPLAFMDYIAGSDLTEDQIAALVEGMARGCRAHDMNLAGGETAQMPGLYASGHYDLAGTILGVVEEDEALYGDQIVPGDVLLGYESTGLHTNGYSLARRIVLEQAGLRLQDRLEGTDQTVGQALLAVHRSYFQALTPVIGIFHGLAHITGGGIAGNLVRILPEGIAAVVHPDAWEWPPLFRLLQRAGRVSDHEMRDVFNLGIGMIAVLPSDQVATAREAAARAGVATWIIGDIRSGPRSVTFTR